MADYGELGYLLANQRAGNRGAAELGAVLGGGGARSQMIFNNAANQGAQMADRLAQARQRQFDEIEKQRQRDSRHKLVESLKETNPLGAQFLDSYENPEQGISAMEKMQQAAAMKQALDLANNPSGVDYNHLNAIKMATAANPTELVRSLGDGSYTTNAYRTDPNVQLSDIGRAFVGEKRALAGEHQAQAERARAGIGADKAANYEVKESGDGGLMLVDKLHPGNAQPVTSAGKPVMGKSTEKSLPEGLIKDALQGADVAPFSSDGKEGNAATPTGKVDPSLLGSFLSAKQGGLSDVAALQALRNNRMAENTQAANTPSPEMKADLAKAMQAPTPGAPKVGEVRKGYRFKGGDPADQSSWEKV